MNGINSDDDMDEKMILVSKEQLEELDNRPFSKKAFNLLNHKVSTYISDLISESSKNSRREKLDGISETHVEKASSYLIAKSRSKIKNLLGTIGGILLGATVSNVVTILSSNSAGISTTNVVATIILAIVGSFLIAFNL